jgi:hypothetical protein
VNGVWDSGGLQYSNFDDSNQIRIVFAMAEAIGGDGGVFFIDFLDRQLTFCFCYLCNCVTSVTRGDLRPPGLFPAVREHDVVISITRGGSVAGRDSTSLF